MQLMEEKSLSNKPDSACGWVLGAHRARCPQTPRAPCSAVLLWQKSLGGTVRQRSCPCQGEPSPLSLPTSAIAQLLAVQLCGFLRDAVAGGVASDTPRPTKTRSKHWCSAKTPESASSLNAAGVQRYICKTLNTKYCAKIPNIIPQSCFDCQ